ncbi:hypothetical protein SMICM17S_01493 [Streptomyces microflavus]
MSETWRTRNGRASVVQAVREPAPAAGGTSGSCRCVGSTCSHRRRELVVLVDPRGRGLVGGLLGARVERGLDGEPAEVPELGALLLGLAERRVRQDRLAYVVAEEPGAADGRDAAVLRLADLQLDRGLHGLVGLGLRDGASGGHPGEDGVTALGGLLRVVDRVVAGRRLDDAGEQRGLLHLQVLGVLGEVPLRRGLDAVRLLTEERDVEVVLQDLLLAELFLDLDRVLQFADLAAERLLGGLRDLLLVVARLLDEDVLHVLLGEGRRALRGPAGLHVAVHRAQDALEVDRPVLVEAGVLDRDDRVLHVRGDVLERDHGPVARVDRRDRTAVAVQDRGPLAERRSLEVGGDLVETFDRPLGGEPQRSGCGQRDACQDSSGERGDTEELGGLLGRGETPARALLWHGGSLIRSYERSVGAGASRSVRVPDRDIRVRVALADPVRKTARQTVRKTPWQTVRKAARQTPQRNDTAM